MLNKYADIMNKETKLKYDNEVKLIQKELKEMGMPPYGTKVGQKEFLFKQIKVAQDGQARLDDIISKGDKN